MLPVPIEPRREQQQYSYLQKHVKTPILVHSSSAIMIAFYFIFLKKKVSVISSSYSFYLPREGNYRCKSRATASAATAFQQQDLFSYHNRSLELFLDLKNVLLCHDISQSQCTLCCQVEFINIEIWYPLLEGIFQDMQKVSQDTGMERKMSVFQKKFCRRSSRTSWEERRGRSRSV